MRGRIFNFQRYAIHDGPGIRSVVFLSSCSLRCGWCCNPESFSADWRYHRDVDVSEVISWLVEDKPYFKNSGGGVTFSGGEPLLQINFLKSILRECKNSGIGTAIETCGEVPWENFASLSGLVDIYLYDIKILDKDMHKKHTGVDNMRILDNLKRLSDRKEMIFLRIPLIPDLNMDNRSAEDVGRLAETLRIAEVHLLPYHRLGEKKYSELNMEPERFDQGNVMRLPEAKEMIGEFASILRNYKQSVLIGG